MHIELTFLPELCCIHIIQSINEVKMIEELHSIATWLHTARICVCIAYMSHHIIILQLSCVHLWTPQSMEMYQIHHKRYKLWPHTLASMRASFSMGLRLEHVKLMESGLVRSLYVRVSLPIISVTSFFWKLWWKCGKIPAVYILMIVDKCIGVGTGGARGAMAPPLFHATTLIRQHSVQLTCSQSHGSPSYAASSAIGRVRYTYKVYSLVGQVANHKSPDYIPAQL